MNTHIEIENKLRKLKPLLNKQYFVYKIGYFGSYARNEQNEDSDIDILVYFRKPIGWEFFDLHELLEKELEIKVDLVSEKALKEQLRQIILNIVIYI
ncbi:MAG: nucleotidyltransferase family protein [Bacteroidales bacterium]|nr:nucleotidyltransferase family protein [Bacteroidales bacterium]